MEYSDKQKFSTMQEEAIKRVREMQKRSRSIVETPDENSDENQSLPPLPNNPKPQDNHKIPPHQPNMNNILGNLFGTIQIDEEKAMIGLLIYILYKQGADIKLLLGLGYLLI